MEDRIERCPALEISGRYVSYTSDYIPPVTFIDADWIEAALAPKACVEIYNEVTNGCLGAVQICDSRNLGNHG